MLRTKCTAVMIAILLVLGLQLAHACTWAVGYFYQVTVLRGRVVGTNILLFQYVRWLRQSFIRKSAKLTLYQYCWPCKFEDTVAVKTVETDSNGKFDFGALGPGHYTLVINEKTWGQTDLYAVEVKNLPRSTDSVTIDVSPNFPDCTGGHEFIVKMK